MIPRLHLICDTSGPETRFDMVFNKMKVETMDWLEVVAFRQEIADHMAMHGKEGMAVNIGGNTEFLDFAELLETDLQFGSSLRY